MESTEIDPYHDIAAYYDLEHDGIVDDAELYVAIADQVDGPVLELGCGSGRLLVPLAKGGHQVTGIDRSATMLTRARSRLLRVPDIGNRVILSQGDMEALDRTPGGPFGLVLYGLNSLMHLESSAAQLTSLRAARSIMLPGGQLIIDTMNPTPQYLTELGRGVIHEWTTEIEDGDTLDKWSIRQIDPVGQTIATILWYDRLDASGHLTRCRTEFILRYVYASELTLMLELAGFRDIRIFGSLDLEPLDESSERIFIIAGVS